MHRLRRERSGSVTYVEGWNISAEETQLADVNTATLISATYTLAYLREELQLW